MADGQRLAATRLPAAQAVGLVLIAMFCAGLLSRKPWLPQILCWAVLLPLLAAVLAGHLRNGSGPASLPVALQVLLAGLAAYLVILLAATALSPGGGPGVGPGVGRHAATSVLCLSAPVGFAVAQRGWPGFALALGRALAVVGAVAGLILLAAHLYWGPEGDPRLQGFDWLHWILNANAVAGVYAILFASALGHALRGGLCRAERLAALCAACPALLVVLLTESRGAMLGCAAGLAIGVASLPRRQRRWALAAGGLLVAVAVPVFLPKVEALAARGDSSRLGLWRHFIGLWLQSPWLGRGLDFDARFVLQGVDIHTPHNILVAALLRGGLAGLGALLGALAGAAWAAAAALRRGHAAPLVVLGTMLALSAVDHELVPGTFSFYWYVFWLPLGLCAAAAVEPSGGARLNTSPGS